MNQLNVVSYAAKPKWTLTGDIDIDPGNIETTFLPDVVKKIGKKSLLNLINAKLDNPRFKVKFDFPKVKRKLMEGEFYDLVLFHHKFTISKPPRVLAITEAIKEVFDVQQVIEDDATITYIVYLDEGLFANTIEEIIYNINRVFGPKTESKAKQLGLNDYHITFNITLFY